MKPLFATLLIAAAAGCAPLDMSIFVEEARFLDDSCEPSGETSLAGGSLDLGPPLANNVPVRYFGHFELRSDLQPLETTSGDDVLAGSSRNEFVATSVNLAYRTTGGFSAAAASEPIYFVVPPSSTDGSILFNMISATAEPQIRGAVAVGGQDTLVVTFHFEGNVRSAANAILPMRTPPVSFPIRLFNSPNNCTAPARPTVTGGPCGNSQEAFVVECL